MSKTRIFYHIVSIIFLAIGCFTGAQAERVYYNSTNNFIEYGNCSNASINKRLLCIDNKTDTAVLNMIPIDGIADADFAFAIRIANVHNREGHYYTILDTKSNTVGKITNPDYGIAIEFENSCNGIMIEFRSGNKSPYEPHDKRYTEVTIHRNKNGIDTILANKTIEDKRYRHNAMPNSIRVIRKSNRLYVQAGNTQYHTVAECELADRIARLGYYTGSGAATAVKNIYIDINRNNENVVGNTQLNEAKIDSIVAESNDRLVGYWSHLDRNNSGTSAKLGGKYRVAIIKNANTHRYDIIYMGGAVVNHDRWKPLMVKGHIIPTKIYSSYNLVWYDSYMEEMNDDNYLSIIDNNIIELSFPTEKISMRFIKE